MDEAAKHQPPENFGASLKLLLSSDGPLLVALGQIQCRAQDMAKALSVADLVTDEGRADALKKQGIIQGLKMAIDIVLDPVKNLEQPEGETK